MHGMYIFKCFFHISISYTYVFNVYLIINGFVFHVYIQRSLGPGSGKKVPSIEAFSRLCWRFTLRRVQGDYTAAWPHSWSDKYLTRPLWWQHTRLLFMWWLRIIVLTRLCSTKILMIVMSDIYCQYKIIWWVLIYWTYRYFLPTCSL